MIAPRSAGKRSVMSASRPSAAGVAPASTNSPTGRDDGRRRATTSGRPRGVVDDQPGRDQDAAAEDPVAG